MVQDLVIAVRQIRDLVRPPKLSFGQQGELAAARFLRKNGYRILMRNYQTRGGEIDIVARFGDVLVFVEVKTRRTDAFAQPFQQVDGHKQHRMTRAARSYLAHYKDRVPPARFDVISIVWPEGVKPRFEHIKNAFQATF